jgi:hypothetical protein
MHTQHGRPKAAWRWPAEFDFDSPDERRGLMMRSERPEFSIR